MGTGWGLGRGVLPGDRAGDGGWGLGLGGQAGGLS